MIFRKCLVTRVIISKACENNFNNKTKSLKLLLFSCKYLKKIYIKKAFKNTRYINLKEF